MQAILAIVLPFIPQLIALIPKMTSGVSELVAFIGSVRIAAKQSNQWTPEMESAFLESLIAYGGSHPWKTDAEIASGK